MTAPTLIAKYKAELLRQKAQAEAIIKPTKEIQAHPRPAPMPSEEKIAQPKPKIHARKPSPFQHVAVAAMMPRPVPQSTVSTYQSGDYQITEKKTFS